MTLQNKTLVAISSCVIGTILAIYLFSGIIVSTSFHELESAYARDNIRRVVEVLNGELDYLSAFGEVYSSRIADDLAGGRDLADVLSDDPILNGGRHDLMTVFDRSGQFIGGMYHDPGHPDRSEVPESWRIPMSATHLLYVPRGSSGRAQGLVKNADGTALLISSTAFTVAGGGSLSRGTFVLGKIFDAGELQRLSRVSKMSLQLIDLAAVPVGRPDADFYRSLTTGAPFHVRVRDETAINAYALLKDTHNRPVYLLEATLSRDIYNQGQATLQYFTKLLLLVGVLATVTAGLLMNRLVLDRLVRLGREIARIRDASGTAERVRIDGKDEFTHLAGEFNKLLDGLHDTRRQLEKQISERLAAETELNKSQELYRRAETIGKLGHWEWDEIGDRMLACSEQYAAIHEMTVKEARSRFTDRNRKLETVHPDDRERVAQCIGQSVENRSGSDIEYRIVTPSGLTRHVHRISEPVFGKNDRLIRTIGTLQDITRQKQVQERLEQYQKRLSILMSELALVEEQERRRIATGLHDSTIQNLGLSKFKLFVLKKSLPDDISTGSLDEVIETLDRAIGDTRSLVFELSPPILYELGFVPAVEWFAEQIYLQRGLVCEVYSDDLSKPLDNTVMVILFQIVRELLVNVAKHARADRATVQINRVEERIRIEVSDNGTGFDVHMLDDTGAGQRGFGLFSIRERLANIGEQFIIESGPGQGTSISFSVPVKQDIETLSL